MSAPRLVLASQSPRRAQLLGMLGLIFDVVPADIDETYLPGEEPGAHAERLAREKAQLIAARHPDAIVVGSDTVVVVDGDVLGKPRDAADGVRMLMRLQARTHEVASGIAVVHGDAVRSAVERVAVRFRHFDESFATAYVATGEPMDKAGAYGIQGYGATLVERIDGDYFAVMGLPIARMMQLLQGIGVRYNFRGLTDAEETT
jgi:septum formation protein